MKYTQEQWKEEMEKTATCSHSNYGSCSIACPWCEITGFYGPRDDFNGRHYRACKFCGWWQEVDGDEPYRCTAVQCLDCLHADAHKVFEGQACRKCGSKNKVQIPWPIDHKEHPAWEIMNRINKSHRED